MEEDKLLHPEIKRIIHKIRKTSEMSRKAQTDEEKTVAHGLFESANKILREKFFRLNKKRREPKK